MSSWVHVSEDKISGKNQRVVSIWVRVHKLYKEARKENPHVLRERNLDALKGRHQRLSTNGNKWVAACKEAYRRIRSGMSQQRPDATGRQSLSPLQKCTGAMRVLAYGTSTDVVDEYLRMSASVTRQALMKFVEGIISCFGDDYLRKPNEQDLARLLYVGEQRGFPGMIGSIDCMHWEWKNCLTAWAGQYTGRSGKPTIILEAVTSCDLWIWHVFFGTPGTCNDINVLHRSPVFYDVLEGRAPKISYVVNGRENDRAYYLTDGIYPSWAAFIKSIASQQTRKHK